MKARESVRTLSQDGPYDSGRFTQAEKKYKVKH